MARKAADQCGHFEVPFVWNGRRQNAHLVDSEGVFCHDGQSKRISHSISHPSSHAQLHSEVVLVTLLEQIGHDVERGLQKTRARSDRALRAILDVWTSHAIPTDQP